MKSQPTGEEDEVWEDAARRKIALTLDEVVERWESPEGVESRTYTAFGGYGYVTVTSDDLHLAETDQ